MKTVKRTLLIIAMAACFTTNVAPAQQSASEVLDEIEAAQEQFNIEQRDRLDKLRDLLSDLPAPDPAPKPDPAPTSGIWISPEEVAALPAGPLWLNVLDYAERTGTPNVSNQNELVNVYAMAKALAYVRTGDERYRAEVIDLCSNVIDTEDDAGSGSKWLAPSRKICGYVIAADLVGLPESVDVSFKDWLRTVRNRTLSGKTLISTHEGRANNWGTAAGATRLAIALYLDEPDEVQRCAQVFRGWLGDRSSYAGFKYGELSWQADPSRPVGINPKGAMKEGRNIDGVLPDDLRRAGSFRWPPPKENYVYGALQGVVAQAIMLERAGYADVWQWEDRAIERAFVWMHDIADYLAEDAGGDDTHMLPVIEAEYGLDYWDGAPSDPGKIVGFTGWTHGRSP